MELLVITSSENKTDEIQAIVRLFKQGLQTLHLRKPKLSSTKLEALIQEIPNQYHDRIMIHGHYDLAIKYKLKGIHLHRSDRKPKWQNKWKRFWLKMKHPTLKISATFSTVQSFRENEWSFDYVLVGPLFTSQAHYHLDDQATVSSLKSQISDAGKPIFAIGGVNEDRLPLIREVGFAGVGISGVIWKNMDDENFSSVIHRIEAA